MFSMNLRHFLLVLFSGSLFVACDDVSSTNSSTQSEVSSEPVDIATIEKLFQKSMEGVEPVKEYALMDKKSGLVNTWYPIPKSWNVNGPDQDIYIEGPNNLKVYKSETNNFAWSDDPFARESASMMGHQVARPLSNQQILDQFVRPSAEAEGYKFIKNYELPEVAGLWQRVINSMPNTGSQQQVEAMGSEWDTPARGTRSLILQVRMQTVKQQSTIWTIQSMEMECDPSYFEKAKNAFIYSFANAKLNPQFIQYMNGELVGNIRKNNDFWAKASAQSAAAHQQRMNAIAARGNAAKSIGDTYSDILDISHKGYLNRSNINDAGHAKTVRSINETALIGNHNTGEHYTVPAGSKYYWVSNDGTYFGTDNALLDPNTDKRMNNKDWTKFAVEQ